MAFSYSVQLSDPNDSGGQLDALLVTDLEAALADWSRLIDGLGTLVLALDVAPTMFGTAQGGATEDVPDGYTSSGATLTEASSVYELTTGQHVAGQTSDITITVDPSYAAKLFLNPDPGDGAPSPPDEVDAVSIFRHELMHGFGMNGYYDGTGKAVDGIGPGGSSPSLTR